MIFLEQITNLSSHTARHQSRPWEKRSGSWRLKAAPLPRSDCVNVISPVGLGEALFFAKLETLGVITLISKVFCLLHFIF